MTRRSFADNLRMIEDATSQQALTIQSLVHLVETVVERFRKRGQVMVESALELQALDAQLQEFIARNGLSPEQGAFLARAGLVLRQTRDALEEGAR
jgi:hypothetical protein